MHIHSKFQCSRWRRSRHNDISVSVNIRWNKIQLWRRQMETFPPYWSFVTSQRASNADLWDPFVVSLNKRMNIHSIGRQFETPRRSFDVTVMSSWATDMINDRVINKRSCATISLHDTKCESRHTATVCLQEPKIISTPFPLCTHSNHYRTRSQSRTWLKSFLGTQKLTIMGVLVTEIRCGNCLHVCRQKTCQVRKRKGWRYRSMRRPK